MKNVLSAAQSTLPLFLGLFVTYLLGAFVGWDFNPAKWEPFGRFVAVLTSPLIILLILMAIDLNRKEI